MTVISDRVSSTSGASSTIASDTDTAAFLISAGSGAPSTVAPTAPPQLFFAQNTSSVTNQYAPNGIVSQSYGTISEDGQEAIETIFGFDPSTSDQGPLANAYSYGNSDNSIFVSNSIGHSETNSQGQAASFVSPTRAATFGQQYGIDNPEDLIATQEVTHTLIKAHPDLRGKLTSRESEIVGNAVSLTQDPDFIAVNITNTIQSNRNPNYAGIADAQLVAMGRVNQELGMGGQGDNNGGNDLMNRYIGYLMANGGNEASINEQSLRGFAQSQGVDPDRFMEVLTRETTAEMTTRAQGIISRALAAPDNP